MTDKSKPDQPPVISDAPPGVCDGLAKIVGGHTYANAAKPDRQPAPDAMLLEAAAKIIHKGAFDKDTGSVHQRREAFAKAVAIFALSAPVPSPDGATEDALTKLMDDAWPDGHREMARKILSRFALSPSATGAAGPVAWRWQHVNDRREPRPWHYEDAPWHGNEYMRAEPLYAIPPVRGGREAIADDIRPREPTPAMRIVGGVAWIDAMKSAETYVDCADACWKAMWDKASI